MNIILFFEMLPLNKQVHLNNFKQLHERFCHRENHY
jgi:hypothetical protein